MPTCSECGDLIQHHYDDGCSRCPCKLSNSEVEYRWILANR